MKDYEPILQEGCTVTSPLIIGCDECTNMGVYSFDEDGLKQSKLYFNAIELKQTFFQKLLKRPKKHKNVCNDCLGIKTMTLNSYKERQKEWDSKSEYQDLNTPLNCDGTIKH